MEKEHQQGDYGGVWGTGRSQGAEVDSDDPAHPEKKRGEISNLIYESLPEGISPIRRPRARWKDPVHKSMRKMGL